VSQGYALHNTGSLPHSSVAGATATGSHGSGDRNGILSTAVSAVDLVKADGSLVTVDRSNPDLKAVAVGLGAFGVIARLVLDMQPTYEPADHRGLVPEGELDPPVGQPQNRPVTTGTSRSSTLLGLSP
jgi:FAD/FMN-containing dehydrogenase